MEYLFKDSELQDWPHIRLVQRVILFGLKIPSVRSIIYSELLISGQTLVAPQVIASFPSSKPEDQGKINVIYTQMIFTNQKIQPKSSPQIPQFFSTYLAGATNYLHCLITYQKVTPSLMQSSQLAQNKAGILNLVQQVSSSKKTSQPEVYVPIALCIQTKSNYIDLFREILQMIYLKIYDIASTLNSSSMASAEFFRCVSFLINDAIDPPKGVSMAMQFGNCQIKIPVDYGNRLPFNDSCISVLLALIDITNIIQCWQSFLLTRHVFVLSCNEYLLFLILQALKMLLFPLKWDMIEIPVLQPQQKMLLQTPFPILIGMNSKFITKEKARRRDPDATILDIDSNIISKQHYSYLCHCVKSRISQKLQLAKAYYYVDSERLNTFKMYTLEQNIGDQAYVNAVRELQYIPPGQKRETAFVVCIRHAFFIELLNQLGDYRRFMQYQPKKKEFEFQSDKFLEQVTCCKIGKMKEFWQEFIGNGMLFNQFIMYYKKFDDSYLVRFNKIIKQIRSGQYSIYQVDKQWNFIFPLTVHPINIANTLQKSLNKFQANTPQDTLKHDFQYRIFQQWKEKLQENNEYFQQGVLNLPCQKSKSLLSCSSEVNIYYGKYGLCRLSQIFGNYVSSKDFRSLTSTPPFFTSLTKQQSWQSLAILFSFHMKKKSKYWDISYLLTILRKMDKTALKAVHNFYILSIIEKVYQQNPADLERLGIPGIQKLSNAFVKSKTNQPRLSEEMPHNEFNYSRVLLAQGSIHQNILGSESNKQRSRSRVYTYDPI